MRPIERENVKDPFFRAKQALLFSTAYRELVAKFARFRRQRDRHVVGRPTLKSEPGRALIGSCMFNDRSQECPRDMS